MDEEIQDVQQPEVETGDISSDVQQTAAEPEVQANSDVLADGTPVESKTVPYSRLEQEITKRAELEGQLKAFQQQQSTFQAQNNQQLDPQIEMQKEAAKRELSGLLKEMGYVSQDQLRQIEADRQLQGEITRLKGTYTGKDGRPKFEERAVIDFAMKNGIPNPEMAYQLMHNSALTNWAVQQAIAGSKGIQTEASNGTGSANAGVTNDDLKGALAKGDRDALHTYLKRVIPKGK